MVAMEFEPGSKLNFRTFPAVRQERVRTARIGNIRTNASERKERAGHPLQKRMELHGISAPSSRAADGAMSQRFPGLV